MGGIRGKHCEMCHKHTFDCICPIQQHSGNPASTGREPIFQVWMHGIGGWRNATKAEYDQAREEDRQLMCAPVAARDLDVEAERPTFRDWWTTPNPVTGQAPRNFMDEQSARAAWFAAMAARSAAQGSAPAPAKKLAHGHRDDFYLLANARRVAQHPISRIRTMPNWALASELFATGSNSARQICQDAGIDPDSKEIGRAPSNSSPVGAKEQDK